MSDAASCAGAGSPSPSGTAPEPALLECVANVSEGRDARLIGALARACDGLLLDVHSDADHHRSVLTFAGPPADVQEAARSLARSSVALLRLTGHEGVHPRLGVLDVVPFVALGGTAPAVAARERDAFCTWAGGTLALPCFRYGPLPGRAVRTLPEVRRAAFSGLAPDCGPRLPHPTAGATAVGARPVLVAYNVWLAGEGATGALARSVARSIRGPAVRALGFELSNGVQVSCNLVDPSAVGPAEAADAVAAAIAGTGAHVARCELVGLLPSAVLHRTPRSRWAALDLSDDRTIEGRLVASGDAAPAPAERAVRPPGDRSAGDHAVGER